MRRIIAIILVLLLLGSLNSALADRYVIAGECENVEDFFKRIEMGTTITTNGFVYSGPFDYEMQNVEGYRIGIYIDIPGCVSKNIFVMASEEQAKNITDGDYISISGQMFSRGNTGINYYFNTQLENGFVNKLDKPEPTILNLNAEKYMTTHVKEHRLEDIAKGEKLEIVKTDEWTDSFSGRTTYYFYIAAGDISIRFHTNAKDLFKGDIIDFEGVIYDYDMVNKILFCRDPIYNIHNIE